MPAVISPDLAAGHPVIVSVSRATNVSPKTAPPSILRTVGYLPPAAGGGAVPTTGQLFPRGYKT
jgi:hypothetical protein